MGTHSLIEALRRRLGLESPKIPDEAVRGFLRVLEDIRLQEMPCSQVFARLDEYVEKELHGEQVALLMPLLREHLDICQDCCAEYDALLSVLEKSSKT